MRDPSIHIKESDLKTVLSEAGLSESHARQIVKRAQRFTCNRSIVHVKQSEKTKAEKFLRNDAETTEFFIRMMKNVRKQLGHRGLKIIKSGSADYLALREGSLLALDFCEDFKLEMKKGFEEYIRTYLKVSGRKVIYNHINSLHEKVCREYEFQNIRKDEAFELVQDFIKEYNLLVLEHTGIQGEYEKQNDYYEDFEKAMLICIEKDIEFRDYIKAQFEGLAFTNRYPYPSQLHGPKAINRLTQSGKMVRKNTTFKLNLNRLKNAGN